MILNKVYNSKAEKEGYNSEEALALYKLKTVLKHIKMSNFDYDIAKDTLYVRKESVLLEDFTPFWFKDGGDYYYFEDTSVRVNELVRHSFVDRALERIDDIKHNTSGEMITFDLPIIYKNGNTRWTSITVDTVTDDNGQPVYAIGYCKDVHDEKKELYRLRNIAQTDELTGLRNRIGGIFKIQQRMEENRDSTFFLAVLDLDKFKNANDLFGHSFGDLVLKNVAERMRQHVDHDTICCRTGGDEFVFFRECENLADARTRLTELRNGIDHTINQDNIEFNVKCSIGFAMFSTQGTEFDELFNKADMAMYHAKKNKIDAPVLYNDSMASYKK